MSSTVKRIIGIIIAAVVIFGALLLLWLWNIQKQQNTASNSGTTTGANSSSVGVTKNQTTGGYSAQVTPNASSSSRSSGSTTPGGSNTAGGTTGGYQSGTYGSLSSGSNTAGGTAGGYQSGTYGNSTNGGTSGGNTPPYSPYTPLSSSTNSTGAVWIPNTGTPFIPTAINSVNSSNPSGSGTIFNPYTSVPQTSGGNSTPGTGSQLLYAGLAVGVPCVAALLVSNIGAAGATAASSAVFSSIAGTVRVYDFKNDLNQTHSKAQSFADCMTRNLAKIALQQITTSVVNWINSGFHGSPTFVTNYQKFFSDVADQAAGTYIQGSGLSFLCSPFALQVKIAVAQSYANQSSTNAQAQSCTLSKVSNNITSFMNGDFSAGGWPALLSFTTVPTNNPFGAYMYGSAGLTSAVQSATQNAKNNISPEGFINMQKVTCPNTPEIRAAGAAYQPPGTPVSGVSYNSYNTVTLSSNSNALCPTQNGIPCKCDITTPGTIIADSLKKQLSLPSDELNMAKNFDEIISALMQQLTTRALQGGVSNLSGQNGYQSNFLTPDQQQTSTSAQTLLTELQTDTTVAQQFGYAQQGNITDLQEAQGQLQTLANCWSSAASSTAFSTAKQSEASTNATQAQDKISTLQTKVDVFNNDIDRVNNAVTFLEQLQTRVLNASSLADVQNIQNEYTSAKTSGTIFSSTDLTAAQQNRTSLQSEMTILNQQTSTQLNQCYAFGT